MLAATVLFMTATYAVMLAVFFLHRFRKLHASVMGAIIAVDCFFPFYLLYLAIRDNWMERLFDGEEMLSFLLWTHLLLVITLYALYFVQVQAGLRLFRGDDGVRSEHRGQGIAILITRALVIMSAVMMVEVRPDVDV